MKYIPELFQESLEEFFDRHDPEKKHLAPKIEDYFPNREKEVFDHLIKLYAKQENGLNLMISESSLFSIPPSSSSGVG